MTMRETPLEFAGRRVLQGEQHVTRQRRLIAELRRRRQATEPAERLLVNLEQLLRMHREQLIRLEEDPPRGGD